MEIKEITNRDLWEKKLGLSQQAQFLQSWAWGEFQKNLGRRVFRLEICGEFFQVIKMPLPFWQNYLYLPRTKFPVSREVLGALGELGRKSKSAFLKIEPVKQNLDNLGLEKAKAVQPQKTLILDLSKSDEELLQKMHSKTRYNIRLAEKKGVLFKEGSIGDLDEFYNLISSTYNRKGLKIYGKNYYCKMLTNFPGAKLYLAEYQGKVLCANLLLFYGDTATYLHGGSAAADKNIMSPHYLQWQSIKKAKELGFKYYDFWGIDEVKWPGVTRFKKGFGGMEVDYAGTWVLPVSKIKYGVYKFLKR